MLGSLRRKPAFLALVVAFAGPPLTGPAFADVKAFNAAVTAGDYKTAAAEAETIWKTWDRNDPDTAIVAREFGFAAMASNRFEFARDLGKFLADSGATLAKPDTMPKTSAVLYTSAAFRLNPGKDERSALRAALLARNAEPGLDMTSVLGWESLYKADFSAGEYEAAGDDAAAAAEFMARDQRLLFRQRAAEVRSASAYFTGSRNTLTRGKNQHYIRMADVHDKLSADIEAATGASARNQLWALKWTAEAWALAMHAHLQTSYSQTGSIMDTSQDYRPLRQPDIAPFPEDPDTASLPVCEGKFEGPSIQYPSSKAFRGMIGSVVVHVETGTDGKVTNVETLASVPYEEFSKAVVDKVKQWTFKPSAKSRGASCRLNYRNHIFRGQFRIL